MVNQATVAEVTSTGHLIPDPTWRTIHQLDRAVVSLKVLIETRLTAMEILHNRVWDQIKEVGSERLDNVTNRLADLRLAMDSSFHDRDTRIQETAMAVAKALDAALRAVEVQNLATATAITKSGMSVVRQVDAVALVQSTAIKNLADKIDAARAWQERADATRDGGKDNRTEQRASNGAMLGLISVAIAGVSLILSAVVVAVALHH